MRLRRLVAAAGARRLRDGRERDIAALVSGLLDWYANNARDLPWRRNTDPYSVLVSEMMLQQTQVATVIPYFDRWMRVLPTIAALASARSETVLKLWEGLGYYSRARNLHRAAQDIQANQGGVFPTDFERVLALPGVGRYTAGAVCSIAFNQPAPILDGNVARVLSRVFMLRGDPRNARNSDKFWRKAEALVSCAHELGSAKTLARKHGLACSSLNQSLMELGALICTPTNPGCPRCPVATFCRARAGGVVNRFPQRLRRPVSETRREVAFLVRRSGNILLRKRPTGAVNAGFYELPILEISPEVPTATAAAEGLGLRVSRPEPLCRVKHNIMRFRITVEVYEAAMRGCSAFLWHSEQSLDQLPLTSITRKALRATIRL